MKFYLLLTICTILISCSGNKETNDKAVLYLTELVMAKQEDNPNKPLSSLSTRNKIMNQMGMDGSQKEPEENSSDCSNLKCKFQFRLDYKQFLQLKYHYKKEIVYYSDLNGYYYFTFNPKNQKFDLQVRVNFKPLSFEGQIFETNIDLETQTAIYSRAGGNKKNWTYLLPSLPTLPVVRIGNQLLICTQDGVITSLNLVTGQRNWFFLSPGAILIQPVNYNNRIIVFDDSGNMFWLDADTGSLRHKYLLEEMPVPSPVLKNNILLVANTRGYLHAIRMSDATSTWRDHSLMGTVESINDSESGFIVHGNASSALFSYHNGSKQKVLARNTQE